MITEFYIILGAIIGFIFGFTLVATDWRPPLNGLRNLIKRIRHRKPKSGESRVGRYLG